MNDTVKIIGIKVTPSKKNTGQFYYTYYYTENFSDYDMESSEVYGIACGSEFTTVNLGCKVGDEVELIYRKGFQNKAQLCGCNIVKAAAVNK